MSMAFFVCGLQLVFLTTHLPTYLAQCGMDAELQRPRADADRRLQHPELLAVRLAGRPLSQAPAAGRHLPAALRRHGRCSSCIPPTPLSVVLFGAAMGMLWLGVIPLVNGLVVQIFGLRFLSTLTGIAFLSHQAGSFLGAWGGGYLFDLMGSYDLAWKIGVFIGLVAGTMQLLMNDRPTGRNAGTASSGGLTLAARQRWGLIAICGDPPHRLFLPAPMAKSRSPAAEPHRFISHPRRARAQSQEHRRRHAARPAGGDHRAVGLGQVVARLRHDLCRGPAPLRREPVGLCPAVPRADAEARRRFDRGPVAGDLDRAEDHLAATRARRSARSPRSTTTCACSVRARRRPLLAGDRPADREPDRLADGRPRPGDARGHAALPAGADRARPQGRVPQGARRAAAARLPAGQGRRQAVRDRRGAGARQEAASTTSRWWSTASCVRAGPRQPRLAEFDRDRARPGRRPR